MTYRLYITMGTAEESTQTIKMLMSHMPQTNVDQSYKTRRPA
jgi:hypothetical protein